MKNNVIEVKNLGRLFRIPNERRDTLFDSIRRITSPINYLELWALEDITFSINEGEFIGIIGENGSGKTTLLKIIAGIMQPTKGYVKTNGRLAPILELGVGFHNDLTGRENIYLYGQLIGIDKKDIDKNISNIIEFSGLKNFIDIKLGVYSSGMRVRLAFSIAIQTNPDILLVDEILAVGDFEFQQKCFDVFKRLKEEGKTVVYVSHDLDSIIKFCDKALLLSEGRQVIFDNPEYVRDRYIYDSIIKEKKLKINFESEKMIPKEEDLMRIENLKKKENVRWGSREVEIMKVELFDKFGEKNNIFVSSDPMKVRIHYRKNKDIKDLQFGIGIFYKDGTHCFGTTTELENYKLNGIKKEGFIDFVIKKLIMWEGDFYLNITAINDRHYHYDWLNKMYMFKVIKLNKLDQGMFNLDCKWKINK